MLACLQRDMLHKCSNMEAGLVVCAADRVGLEVVRFVLGQKRVPLSAFILHPRDPGGCNKGIGAEVSSRSDAPLYHDPESFLAHSRGSSTRPSLGILAWWPVIVKEPLLSLPQRGWVNFHPSLLPYNRGKHPNFWALRSSTPFGVSLQMIDAGIDTGPVIAQRQIEVGWTDNAKTLHDAARKEIVSLFIEKFDSIVDNTLPPVQQDESLATSHHSSEIEKASRIELDTPTTARDVLNLIRARTFPPHPGAWFEEDGEQYEVRIDVVKRQR